MFAMPEHSRNWRENRTFKEKPLIYFNFSILAGKYPLDPQADSLTGLLSVTTTIPYQIEELDIEAAIRSFPSGSAGGLDGLRP